MSSQKNAPWPTVTDGELELFVAHSNRIEGEPDRPGHPLFDHHLALAREVADTPPRWWDPLDIHRRLLASQKDKFPGEMRQVGVSVGGKMKLHPIDVREELPRLMVDMDYGMRPSLGEELEQPKREAWCWGMHHRFEWIHPFWDGNGRTGRLWMNALRLSLGLPWLTVRYEDRFDYYRSIEGWEREHEEKLRRASD